MTTGFASIGTPVRHEPRAENSLSQAIGCAFDLRQ
jgi:hypothetical protein